MDTEISLEEFRRLLEGLGISPTEQLLGILLLLAMARFFGLFGMIFNVFKVIWGKIKDLARIRYNKQEKDFVEVRNRFVTHLIYEVERLNREADWNDFYYTQLEAEVEVDHLADLDSGGVKKFMARFWAITSLLKELFQRTASVQKKDSLVEAITDSNSRAFLVIGDPGSGKTVSLRHLFLKLAEGCKNSRNKNTVVPLYLNLKGLDIPANEITGDSVRQWVLEQLQAGQDRLIYEFLNNHFDSMLDNGRLFFMFDSFDEIPAVMDAQEDTEIVGQYALALNRFLHAPHQCRGLVSSRPYRAPKIFMGQRMTIRALSDKRIRNALRKYLSNERQLYQQLWQELVSQRDDLLHVSRNPFYLGLMARYVSENKRLPDRQYDLFEHFIQSRVRTDKKRLHSFGLNPEMTVKQASQLAFVMTKTPYIGLEANEAQILEILAKEYPNEGWGIIQVKQLLGALTYSKIGRRVQENSKDSTIFSFVHRRFHEYFCARHLRELPDAMPAQSLLVDNRWREVLVLLCEVLPVEQLDRIFEVASYALQQGGQTETGTPAHRQAIEALRFLRDGFHSRITDLPIAIRQLSAKFIQKQLTEGNLLDQKRTIESLAVADQDNMASLLEQALRSESTWLRNVAFRSCRIPNSLNHNIVADLRRHLYFQYVTFHLHRNYETYRTLLSGSPSLVLVKQYAEMLLGFTGVQLIFIFLSLSLILRANFAAFLITALLALFMVYLTVIAVLNWEAAFFRVQGTDTNEDQGEKSIIKEIQYSVDGFLRGYLQMNTRNDSNVQSHYSMLVLYNPLMVTSVVTMSLLIKSFPFFTFWLVGGFLIQLILVPITIMWVDFPASGIFIWLQDNMKHAIVSVRKQWRVLVIYILLILGGGFSVKLLLDVLLKWVYFPYMLLLIELIFVMVSFVLWAARLLYDQRRLAGLIVQPNTRPYGARRAISLMKTFKTKSAKKRFVQKLFQWMIPNREWPILIEAALEEKGDVRDLLYQLAEIWEDSSSK